MTASSIRIQRIFRGAGAEGRFPWIKGGNITHILKSKMFHVEHFKLDYIAPLKLF